MVWPWILAVLSATLPLPSSTLANVWAKPSFTAWNALFSSSTRSAETTVLARVATALRTIGNGTIGLRRFGQPSSKQGAGQPEPPRIPPFFPPPDGPRRQLLPGPPGRAGHCCRRPPASPGSVLSPGGLPGARPMHAPTPTAAPIPDFATFRPEHFRWALDGKVATITLDRPDRKNPLTFGSYAELRDTFRALTYADQVNSVVITGAGSNFCSRGDLPG